MLNFFHANNLRPGNNEKNMERNKEKNDEKKLKDLFKIKEADLLISLFYNFRELSISAAAAIAARSSAAAASITTETATAARSSTTSATAAAARPSAASAAASATFSFRTGFIDNYFLTADFFSIKTFNSLLCFSCTRHFNKPKTLGFS
jgi:nucleoid-associated protein YgaU